MILPRASTHLNPALDVGITQLDWKRVPRARSGGCKSPVAVRNYCVFAVCCDDVTSVSDCAGVFVQLLRRLVPRLTVGECAAGHRAENRRQRAGSVSA